MSDEEDYMSSAFLTVSEDIRPGLVFSRQVKRKHEIEKKRVESNKIHKTKSRKELEEESRNAGLNIAISSDNKGFAMLQKMGYKPGMKLGPQKESSSNSGLSEPIKIQVKTGRGGLGREEEIRKRIVECEEKRSRIKVYKEEETDRLTKEFCERMRNKTFMRNLMSDLRKSQKVCQQLDTENDVSEPMRPWFWYTVECDEEEEEEEEEEENEEPEDEIEPDEQLSFILDYVRTKYLYCLWCGTRYDNEDDMNTNCPGIEKSDHDDEL